jgi:hypothetical protein
VWRSGLLVCLPVGLKRFEGSKLRFDFSCYVKQEDTVVMSQT